MATTNSATARMALGVISSGDLAAVHTMMEEFCTPDCAYHGMGEELSGHDGMKGLVTGFLTAFPDLTLTVEGQVEDGEIVVTRFVATGTNTGEFMGKPPTGKAMRMQAISMMRFVDGKIAEEWEEADLLGMMGQIGLL